jgi:hypothetical protein
MAETATQFYNFLLDKSGLMCLRSGILRKPSDARARRAESSAANSLLNMQNSL